MHLPDGNGPEVVEALPDVRFLALSVSDAAEDVIAVIRAGARGYVTKSISPPSSPSAIRRVHEGDAVFSPRLAGFVLDAFAGQTAPAIDPELDQLTPREREVLRYIARGYAYKEIARELHISVKTVGEPCGRGAAEAPADEPVRAQPLGERSQARLRQRSPVSHSVDTRSSALDDLTSSRPRRPRPLRTADARRGGRPGSSLRWGDYLRSDQLER